jgi:hypothetical protein
VGKNKMKKQLLTGLMIEFGEYVGMQNEGSVWGIYLILGIISTIIIAACCFMLGKRKNVTEDRVGKILIICPYCGFKYEQGLEKCPNCGG